MSRSDPRTLSPRNIETCSGNRGRAAADRAASLLSRIEILRAAVALCWKRETDAAERRRRKPLLATVSAKQGGATPRRSVTRIPGVWDTRRRPSCQTPPVPAAVPGVLVRVRDAYTRRNGSRRCRVE
jgi:hypothetical protein